MNAWALRAWCLDGHRIDTAGHAGMGLIVAGVLVLNLFPSSSAH